MERIKRGFSKIKEGQMKLRKEIAEKTVGYILAAFSFVAGLAWNDAIKSFIDQFFPANKNGVFIKLVYAVIITIIIVLVTVLLVRFTQKKEGSQQ